MPVSLASKNYLACFAFWSTILVVATFFANRLPTIPSTPERASVEDTEVRPAEPVEAKAEANPAEAKEVAEATAEEKETKVLDAVEPPKEKAATVLAVKPAPVVDPNRSIKSVPPPVPAKKTAKVHEPPVAKKAVKPQKTNSLGRAEVNASNVVAIVDLHSLQAIEKFEVTRNPSSASIILDLKGNWRVDKGVEKTIKADHQNLREVAISRHSQHLRVVFRLRELQENSLELLKMDYGMRLWIR